MVLSLIPAPKEGSFKLSWLENRLVWLARSKIGLFLKAFSFGVVSINEHYIMFKPLS
jgi:hypothetical protein